MLWHNAEFDISTHNCRLSEWWLQNSFSCTYYFVIFDVAFFQISAKIEVKVIENNNNLFS